MLEESCIENMELGNLLFGHSRGKYQLPREEWQPEFHKFLEISGFDIYGHIDNPNLQKFLKKDNKKAEILQRTEISIDEVKEKGKLLEKNEEEETYEYKGINYIIYSSPEEKYFDDYSDWFEKTDEGLEVEEPDRENYETEEKIYSILEVPEEYEYFENDIFSIFPYYWGNEESIAQLPNFVYKPKNIEISWYKRPLRDAYINQDISFEEFKEMLEDCKKSVKKV